MEREFIHYTHLPLGIKITTHCYTDINHKWRGTHFHDEIEIVYVDKGELSVEVQNETFNLTTGQIVLISSKVIHKIIPFKLGSVFTYIQLNINEYMKDDIHTPLIFNFTQSDSISAYVKERDQGELWNITSKLLDEYKNKDTAYYEYIYAYIHMLIAYMTRQGLFNTYDKTIRQKIFRLMPAIEYANNNFPYKLKIDDIASQINVTKYHFCKLFKDATGQSFSAYINYVRIIKAEELLLSSDKTISEIAFSCGFNSVQYFNRIFVNRYGYSPFKYKKLKTPIKVQKL